MNRLYDVLESCMVEIERGVDVDVVLSRHPELSEKLYPVVEASIQAKKLAVTGPSTDIVRRSRNRVLQRAGELDEVGTTSWNLSLPLRRASSGVPCAVVASTWGESGGMP